MNMGLKESASPGTQPSKEPAIVMDHPSTDTEPG